MQTRRYETIRGGVLAAAIGLLASACTLAADGSSGGIPDLLKGEGPDPVAITGKRRADWYLHFYETRGWIFGKETGQTDQARQLLITVVPDNSAAKGQLQVGDVILGVKGKRFDRNPVEQFRAVSAPAALHQRPLRVTMWRKGWNGPREVELKGKLPIPDFTRGGKPNMADHDWTLGPTGARGRMWGYKLSTAEARQILVTEVAKGSPGDGVLRVGDVILGIGNKPFDDDARMQLGRAITEAEKVANGGRLRLLRWRDGASSTVTVQLQQLGTYNATAPYGCSKSREILDIGCSNIARRGIDRVSIPNSLNALALLASGKEEYRPIVDAYAAKAAEHVPSEGLHSWTCGYVNMFLAEYVLATGNDAARQGLRRLSLVIARGQSDVGTYGHRFAEPGTGKLKGYGAMNCTTLAIAVSLRLAREAGIREPDIDRAIARSKRFYEFYIGAGAIPYGDHDPWTEHGANGKSSLAAVLFDLYGNAEGANFFARTSAAAHKERDMGHTGNYFHYLWSMPGLSRCGPAMTGAYFKEMQWHYDLARAWDGSILYPGAPGTKGKIGHKCEGWDSTGAYMLAYALPLRSLYITGKRPSAARHLGAREIAETLEAGRDFKIRDRRGCYDGRSTDRLFSDLRSWFPAVRTRAAHSLAKREIELVQRARELLVSSDVSARLGACELLEYIGPRGAAAAEDVARLTSRGELWLRIRAVKALGAMGPDAAGPHVNEVLRLVLRHDPNDPRRMFERFVSLSWFNAPRKSKVKPLLAPPHESVDRGLLVRVLKSMLSNEDGKTRSTATKLYAYLTPAEITEIMPEVVRSVREKAPSGMMFEVGSRLNGLALLQKQRSEVGIQLCLDVMQPGKWGAGKRIEACLKTLIAYGAAAQVAIPELERVRDVLAKNLAEKQRRNKKATDPLIEKIDKAIQKIRSART